MSLINISKQWDKWDKRLKNLFFQIEIVPSDLGSGGERVRPWQKIICLVPTWGKKEGSCGLFSLFHNLEREQPVVGDQSECGRESLGRSSWDWCCSQLGESEAPSPLLLGILVKWSKEGHFDKIESKTLWIVTKSKLSLRKDVHNGETLHGAWIKSGRLVSTKRIKTWIF